MSILTLLPSLFSGIGSIAEKVIEGKAKKAELKQVIKLAEQQLTQSIEKELTKRHESDMVSDSWLSKNIRPMSLVFLVAVITLLAFFDGNVGDFKVDSAYISLFQALLLTSFSFYFGSRGYEKIARLKLATRPKRKPEKADPLDKYDWSESD